MCVLGFFLIFILNLSQIVKEKKCRCMFMLQRYNLAKKCLIEIGFERKASLGEADISVLMQRKETMLHIIYNLEML